MLGIIPRIGLSNNLANINTVGFKADQPEFRLDPSADATQNASAQGRVLNPFSPPMQVGIDFMSGQSIQTGNSLDVAISGSGFFEVRTDNGTEYTRNGNLTVNPDGVLSTSDGFPIMGEGGEINIQGARVEIAENGDVIVDDNVLGRLKVVDFPRPYDLKRTGNTRFVPAKLEVSSQPASDYSIAQGFVEASNVDAIRTMTEIIETTRVFESYQRVIRASDDATAKAVSEVGRSI
ncbi:MAG: flagellar hook-basal body protein [Desulfosarcinaceae bacterium]